MEFLFQDSQNTFYDYLELLNNLIKIFYNENNTILNENITKLQNDNVTLNENNMILNEKITKLEKDYETLNEDISKMKKGMSELKDRLDQIDTRDTIKMSLRYLYKMLFTHFSKEMKSVTKIWDQIDEVKKILSKPEFKRFTYVSQFIEEINWTQLNNLNEKAHDSNKKKNFSKDCQMLMNLFN